MDYYNGITIAKILKANSIDSSGLESLIGYHGIVTDQYLYIRNHLGTETFEPRERMDCDTFEKNLAHAKQHVRYTKIDVEHDEKFKYSKYVYKIFERYDRRTGNLQSKIESLIRQLFSTENCRYAIRGGGMCTWQLLLRLTPEQRKGVLYIIDRTDDCVVGKVGFQIIHPDQVTDYEIDMIVLPSFQLREIMHKELTEAEATVIDLYTYLQSHGIFCDRAFYQRAFEASDYDVGFPFSDFADQDGTTT